MVKITKDQHEAIFGVIAGIAVLGFIAVLFAAMPISGDAEGQAAARIWLIVKAIMLVELIWLIGAFAFILTTPDEDQPSRDRKRTGGNF